MFGLFSYVLDRANHNSFFTKGVIAPLSLTRPKSSGSKRRSGNRQHTLSSRVIAASERLGISKYRSHIHKSAIEPIVSSSYSNPLPDQSSLQDSSSQSVLLSESSNKVLPLCNIIDLHRISDQMKREAVISTSQIVVNFLLIDLSSDIDFFSKKQQFKNHFICLIQEAVKNFIQSTCQNYLEQIRAIRYPFLIAVTTKLNVAEALRAQSFLYHTIVTYLKNEDNLFTSAKPELNRILTLFKKMFLQPVVWVMDQQLSQVVKTGYFQKTFLSGRSSSSTLVIIKNQAFTQSIQKSSETHVKAMLPSKKYIRNLNDNKRIKFANEGDFIRAKDGVVSSTYHVPFFNFRSSTSSGIFHDNEHEKVIWQSQKDNPVDLDILQTFLDQNAYKNLLKKISSCSARSQYQLYSQDERTNFREGRVYVVLYSLGVVSTIHGLWQNILKVVKHYCQDALKVPEEVLKTMPIETMYASASLNSEVPVNMLVPRVKVKNTSSSQTREGSVRLKRAKKHDSHTSAKKNSTDKFTPMYDGVYLLIHASRLISEDVKIFRIEIQKKYEALPRDVKCFFFGLHIISQEQINLHNLEYLLCSTASPFLTFPARKATNLLPSLTDAKIYGRDNYFRDVYCELANMASCACSGSNVASFKQPHQHTLSSLQGSPYIPSSSDVLIHQSIQIARLFQSIIEKREAQSRLKAGELDGNIYPQPQTEHDEMLRSAQTVQLRSMITETVDEVSARHEQATSHLVKSLSSIIGEWSPEKLFDVVEVLLKERVGPLRDDLQLLIQSSGTLAQSLAQTNANISLILKGILDISGRSEGSNSSDKNMLSLKTLLSPSPSRSPSVNEQIGQLSSQKIATNKETLTQSSTSVSTNVDNTIPCPPKLTLDTTKTLDRLDKLLGQIEASHNDKMQILKEINEPTAFTELLEILKEIKQIDFADLVNKIEEALKKIQPALNTTITDGEVQEKLNIAFSANVIQNQPITSCSQHREHFITPLVVQHIADSLFHHLKEYLTQCARDHFMMCCRILRWMHRKQEKHRLRLQYQPHVSSASCVSHGNRDSLGSRPLECCWDNNRLTPPLMQLLLLQPSTISILLKFIYRQQTRLRQTNQSKK